VETKTKWTRGKGEVMTSVFCSILFLLSENIVEKKEGRGREGVSALFLPTEEITGGGEKGKGEEGVMSLLYHFCMGMKGGERGRREEILEEGNLPLESDRGANEGGMKKKEEKKKKEGGEEIDRF